MASFSIGEVEKITGIKPHILRYWEEIVPSLSPQKDSGGRRLYSSRNIQLILRLKYLIYEKKFTIEGARNQLIEDLNVKDSTNNLLQNINELKDDILTLYKRLQRQDK